MALKSSHLQIDAFLKSQPDISWEFIRYLIIFYKSQPDISSEFIRYLIIFYKSQPDISSEFIRYLIIFIFSRSFRSSRRSQGAERRGLFFAVLERGEAMRCTLQESTMAIENLRESNMAMEKPPFFCTNFPYFPIKKPPFTVGFPKNAMFDHQRVRILFLDSLTWLIRKWWEWSVWGFDQQECLIKPAILI